MTLFCWRSVEAQSCELCVEEPLLKHHDVDVPLAKHCGRVCMYVTELIWHSIEVNIHYVLFAAAVLRHRVVRCTWTCKQLLCNEAMLC